MRAIILAAGKGSRLLNPSIPKPMTQLVNGKSIIQMQVEHFQRCSEIREIFVVVGYQKQTIINAFPQLSFVDNPMYAEENTAKSLLKAIKGVNEDILWANGDVVFHSSVLPKLVQAKHSAMLVNAASVAEEEVKYRSDANGFITEVSKEVKNPEGEALGINIFRKEHLHLLEKSLLECNQNDYFEKGVETCINKGAKIKKIVVPYEHCVEIDFPEDITRANSLLESWE